MGNGVYAFGPQQLIMPVMAMPPRRQTNDKGAGRHCARCANWRIFKDDTLANVDAQRLGGVKVNIWRRLAPRHMLAARINMRVKIIL